MQNKRGVSLNAVRVFVLTARHLSIVQASAEIGVTPSAVSHQIKKLEVELGVALFKRSHNALALTDAGRRFYDDAATAISAIDRSAEALSRDQNEIVVRVSISLAVRWLIPALERFKAIHPAARVRVETKTGSSISLGSGDLAISYHRAGTNPAEGEWLAADMSRPVASPALLAAVQYEGSGDLGKVPALQCAVDNWDWALWTRTLGLERHAIQIQHVFDTDDAALHAATAGLGMVLAPAFLTEREIRSGGLVALPGFGPVDLGHYRVVFQRHENRMTRKFRKWLGEEMQRMV
jgi:LysR family glycine cleavage system transcriptional activator